MPAFTPIKAGFANGSLISKAVIPVIIAIVQAFYAFAPAVFGFIRVANVNGDFILAMTVKVATTLAYLHAKRSKSVM